MNNNNYAQADLRFFLPVRAEQEVLVIGNVPALIKPLQEIAHVTIMMDWEACFSLPAHRFDHVFVMYLPHSKRQQLQACLEHLLYPGGWACVAVQNSQSIRSLRFWKHSSNQTAYPEPPARFSFKECQTRFPEVQSIYGIYDTLNNPQYFVPLTNPAITRFFISKLMVPATTTTRLMMSALLILTRYRLQFLFFHDMIVIIKIP